MLRLKYFYYIFNSAGIHAGVFSMRLFFSSPLRSLVLRGFSLIHAHEVFPPLFSGACTLKPGKIEVAP